ncbi:MAG: DUF3224 domain-containing protein [Gemmatimonadota bacterium]|nr:DUF3224 domain-containing protein [Gemmatimonadota bacterium]
MGRERSGWAADGGGHVVPGSGTRELAGLSGQVQIAVDADGAHTLMLDYEIS